MATTETIQHIDTYFHAIKVVRAKQLEILRANVQQQNENEIEIWNNLVALTYIEKRYAILKEALLLLSDSREHVWLEVGKQKRENSYAPLINPLMSEFNSNNMAQSLDDLWNKMTAEDFQKEISRLKRKISIEQAFFSVLLTTAVLLGLAFLVTCMVLGLSIHSFALYISGFAIPMGILGLICCFAGINQVMTGIDKPLFKMFSPILFKEKIAKQFSFLEQAFQAEKIPDFSQEGLSFSIPMSTNVYNVTDKELIVKRPFTFQTQDKPSRDDLHQRFHGSRSCFFSSSESSSAAPPPLKEAVEVEYSLLLAKK